MTSNNHSKTILLVEDEGLIALSGAKMLQKHGYKVFAVASGEDAIETVQSTPEIDLILMDINLGSGMTGTQAAEIILEERELPLIFLSSHTEIDVVEKTEGITSYGYVVKGSGETVILASIKMAFQLFEAREKAKEKDRALAERVKELNCLYGLSKLVESADSTLEDIFRGIVELIPPAWQYPEITCARLHLSDGREFKTENYRDTEWQQSCDIPMKGAKYGSLCIGYVRKMPEIDEGPFLKEERALLDALGERLGKIIERKQMELALQEQKTLRTGILENLKFPFYAADSEYRYTMFNTSHAVMMKALFGVEIEVGKSLLDYYTVSTDREKVRRYIDRALQGETVIVQEQTDDESRRYFEISHFPIREIDGIVIGVAIMARDVTDRMQAQEALRESEEKYRTLFERVSDAIFIYDPDTYEILEANEATAKIYGYESSELIGMSCLKFSAEVDKSRASGEQVRADGNVDVRERHHRKKDGSDLYVHITGHKITFKRREVCFAVSRDITDSKRLKDALKESEALSRIFFEQANDAIHISNLDGEILTVNSRLCELLGYTREELQHLRVSDLQAPEYRVSENVVQIEMEKYGKSLFEGVDLHRNGSRVPVEISVSHIEGPREDLYVSIVRDITDRKQAEEKLVDALKKTSWEQRKTQALLTGARAILEQKDFPETARHIFDSCKELIGATAGYVALLTPDGHENEVLFLDPGGNECTVDPNLPMPIRGLRGEAYRTGKAAFDNDFEQSEWTQFLPAGHAPLENVMFAPLMIDGRARGLIGLANKPGGFTEEDASVATAFGELASIALRNSWVITKLHESEERYRTLVDLSPCAILVQCEGRYVFVNPTGLCMFGASDPDQLLGKPVLNFVHPDYREIVQERIQHVSTGSLAPWIEEKYLRLDGSSFDVDVAAIQITYLGKPATQVIARDITERKQMEDELKESERKYRQIVETAQEGIWLIDLQGNTLFVNQRITDMLGYTVDEIQAAPVFHFLDQSQHQSARASLQNRQHGIDELVERCFVRKDGSPLWVLNSTSPIHNNNGEIIGSMGMLTDITERKEAEEALRKAFDEKNILLRELQHRVKNSFTLMGSIISLMSDSVQNEAGRILLGKLGARVRAMTEMYNLLYTTDAVTDMQLDQYFAKIIASMPLPENMFIEQDFQPIPVSVKIAAPLGMILTELITNSIKYAFPENDGGIINVTLKKTEAGAVFEVSDNGVGLPDGFDLSTSESLGLIIVQSLVKQIDGSFLVYSGSGARWLVEIPLCSDENF